MGIKSVEQCPCTISRTVLRIGMRKQFTRETVDVQALKDYSISTLDMESRSFLKHSMCGVAKRMGAGRKVKDVSFVYLE